MSRFLRTSLLVVAACALAGSLEGCKKVVPPVAKMGVSPASKLDWGEVPLKAGVTRKVVIANQGDETFLITKVSLSPDNGPFRVIFDKHELAKDQTLEVPIVFLADAEGAKAATLTIEVDLPAIPKVTISLAATVVPDLFCGPCAQPPRDACLSGSDLLLNERAGTCPDGQCQFARRVLDCAAGCDFLHLTCNDVACEPGAATSVASGDAAAQEVAMAGAREAYGLVWSAPKDGKKALTFSLYGPDRKQRTEAPVPLAKITGEAWAPALAFNGDAFGLAFVGNKDGDEEIYATTVGLYGNTIREPVRITEAAGNAASPAMALGEGAKGELGLVWADGRAAKPGIYFTRMSAFDATPMATEVDVSQLPVEAHAAAPAVAWGGSSWLVAWSDNRDGDGSEIYVRRLSEAGVPTGDPIRITSAPGESVDPQLAWDGSRFVLVWSDARDGRFTMYARDLMADGTPDGDEEPLALTAGNMKSPRMSLGTGLQAFAWIDDGTNGADPGLYAAVRSHAQPTLEPQRISGATTLLSPVLAPSFGQFGLAFVGVQPPRPVADVFLHTACLPPAKPGDPGTTP